MVSAKKHVPIVKKRMSPTCPSQHPETVHCEMRIMGGGDKMNDNKIFDFYGQE
jgi:hypothetical protein